MRRDVIELRRFYASRLGTAAREMIGRKVTEAWGDADGLDLLALGYATPFLAAQQARARRVAAAMPEGQGLEVWPSLARNAACLVDEAALPFPNALFDRVLMAHGLEEAEHPVALLRETHRVMAPSGRLIVVAAARNGVWCNAENTPFGHGRPFTRSQLEEMVREAELEPTAWSRALYVPPVAWLAGQAGAFELFGAAMWPPFAGVILMEAVKQTFAVKPKGLKAPARALIPAGARPVAAGRSGAEPIANRLGPGSQTP